MLNDVIEDQLVFTARSYLWNFLDGITVCLYEIDISVDAVNLSLGFESYYAENKVVKIAFVKKLFLQSTKKVMYSLNTTLLLVEDLKHYFRSAQTIFYLPSLKT